MSASSLWTGVVEGFAETGREFAVLRIELAEMRAEMARNSEIVLTAIRERRE